MNKQTVYILTGLPYAGKTTLRNQLVERFGFSSVSVDEAMDRKGFDPDTMIQSDWILVYSEAYEQLKKELVDGKSVIVDIGNLKRSERDTARAIGRDFGAESKLIYINTPRWVIGERWIRNHETKARGQLSDEMLQRAFEMFEEPTADEKPIMYNQTMNMDEWMRLHVEGRSQSSKESPPAALK